MKRRFKTNENDKASNSKWGWIIRENANKFVNKCSNFKSSITVSYAYKTVNAKSILAVLYLGATQYSFIEITISGTDEELAHDVIIEFLTDNL